MATQQLLVHLPEDLVQRLKRRVPARGRSAFVQKLLEQALPADEGGQRTRFISPRSTWSGDTPPDR